MKFLKIIYILLFALSFSIPSFSDCGLLPACVGDDGEVPGDVSNPLANCCDDVTVPFDGGVSLLIAAGLGIGARGVYKRRKQQAS